MVDSEKVLYPVYRDRIKIIIEMVGKLMIWAGAGDSNGWKETSAPVKDGVGEVGVYVPSFRARYSARHSQ